MSTMVKLTYAYSDGTSFTTETMLRDEALAYMPILQAHPTDDADTYQAKHFTVVFVHV